MITKFDFFFLISPPKIFCVSSLEPPKQGGFNEVSRHIFCCDLIPKMSQNYHIAWSLLGALILGSIKIGSVAMQLYPDLII